MDVHDVACPVGIAALSCEPEQSELDRDVGMVRRDLRSHRCHRPHVGEEGQEAFERIVERLESADVAERMRQESEATLALARKFVGDDEWWTNLHRNCVLATTDAVRTKLSELLEGEDGD
jgi:hypothetical protein